MCLSCLRDAFSRPSSLGHFRSDTFEGPGGRWSRAWMKEIGWGLTASHGWPGWDWHGEFDGLVGRQIMKHHKLIKMKLP